GFFVDFLSWRYVFWMNIPLGIIAMLGIIFFLHENVEKEKQAIDYGGAIWMMVAVSSLMFVLVEGGVGFAWNSSLIVMLLIIAATAFICFVWLERRATDP